MVTVLTIIRNGVRVVINEKTDPRNVRLFQKTLNQFQFIKEELLNGKKGV